MRTQSDSRGRERSPSPTGGAGTTFTVNQDPAPCTYGLSPTGATPPGTGTSASITVTTLVGCAWTAVSNDSWISVNQDPEIPDAPSNMAAVALSRSKVKLTWDDNSGNEVEFRLERKLGAGGTYALIATFPADTTGTTDSPVEPSTTYFYRVMACNSAGCSAASGEVSVTTPSLGFFIGEEQ